MFLLRLFANFTRYSRFLHTHSPAFDCSIYVLTARISKIPTIFFMPFSFCGSLSNFIYFAFMCALAFPLHRCRSLRRFLFCVCAVLLWFSMDLYWCVCRRANNQTKNQIAPEVKIKLRSKRDTEQASAWRNKATSDGRKKRCQRESERDPIENFPIKRNAEKLHRTMRTLAVRIYI